MTCCDDDVNTQLKEVIHVENASFAELQRYATYYLTPRDFVITHSKNVSLNIGKLEIDRNWGLGKIASSARSISVVSSHLVSQTTALTMLTNKESVIRLFLRSYRLNHFYGFYNVLSASLNNRKTTEFYIYRFAPYLCAPK